MTWIDKIYKEAFAYYTKEFASDEQRRGFFGTHPEAASNSQNSSNGKTSGTKKDRINHYLKNNVEKVPFTGTSYLGNKNARYQGISAFGYAVTDEFNTELDAAEALLNYIDTHENATDPFDMQSAKEREKGE